MKEQKRTITSRKADHVKIVETQDVEYRKATGFDDVDFLHCAMPDMDMEAADTSLYLFGKKLSSPILIDSMTGGYEGAEIINRRLAKAAQDQMVAFSFGSMRPMLKDSSQAKTYSVRNIAPDIPLIGNIGIANLPTLNLEDLETAISRLELDALAVHFNPLQEAVQIEGDRDFTGVSEAFGRLCDRLDIPVIAKETGAGMSDSVCRKLADLGATMINVSGAGGTSWSKVEYARKGYVQGFGEWGIPTAVSILMCSKILPTIASGGVRSGMDIAKSIALGAKLGAAASPFLKAGDPNQVIKDWTLQLKTVMFLTNSKKLADLGHARVTILGDLSKYMFCMGIDHFKYSQR